MRHVLLVLTAFFVITAAATATAAPQVATANDPADRANGADIVSVSVVHDPTTSTVTGTATFHTPYTLSAPMDNATLMLALGVKSVEDDDTYCDVWNAGADFEIWLSGTSFYSDGADSNAEAIGFTVHWNNARTSFQWTVTDPTLARTYDCMALGDLEGAEPASEASEDATLVSVCECYVNFSLLDEWDPMDAGVWFKPQKAAPKPTTGKPPVGDKPGGGGKPDGNKPVGSKPGGPANGGGSPSTTAPPAVNKREKVTPSLLNALFARAVKKRHGTGYKVKTNCRIVTPQAVAFNCKVSYSRRGAATRYGQVVVRVTRAKNGKIVRARIDFTGKIKWSNTVGR